MISAALKLLLDVAAAFMLAAGIVKGIPALAAAGGILLTVGIVWLLRTARDDPGG